MLAELGQAAVKAAAGAEQVAVQVAADAEKAAAEAVQLLRLVRRGTREEPSRHASLRKLAVGSRYHLRAEEFRGCGAHFPDSKSVEN